MGDGYVVEDAPGDIERICFSPGETNQSHRLRAFRSSDPSWDNVADLVIETSGGGVIWVSVGGPGYFKMSVDAVKRFAKTFRIAAEIYEDQYSD